MRFACWLSICVCLVLTFGCSKGDLQTRYQVSGTITYDGQPVNFGEVLFTPDGSKGNSGAQGIADIKNGKYDTRGSRAPGVAGGAMIVRVTASSDAKGKLLVEVDFPLELPKSDTVHNIDLPKVKASFEPSTPEI